MTGLSTSSRSPDVSEDAYVHCKIQTREVGVGVGDGAVVTNQRLGGDLLQQQQRQRHTLHPAATILGANKRNSAPPLPPLPPAQMTLHKTLPVVDMYQQSAETATTFSSYIQSSTS